MYDAYRIGISIGVLDLTRGSILKIAAQFANAQKEASAFLATLRTINEQLRTPSSWAGTAANDFRNARREAEGFAGAARSARSSTSAAYPLAIYAAARGMGSGPRPPSWTPQLLTGPSGGGVARSGFGGMWPGSGGGGMGYAGAGFAAGAGGRGGGFGFGPLGQVFGGMLIEHAGKAELGMLGGPIEEAAKYQTAVAKFSLLGLGDKLNADAVKFAGSMNIIGTSVTDAMTFMTEAQGVFREAGLNGPAALSGAKLAAPFLAKMSFATRGLDDETKAKYQAQGLSMLRFVEQRGGLTSPEKFKQEAEAGWKAIVSSGGNINWEQLRQFMRTAGIIGQTISDESLFGAFEPIIGEQKGQTAGFGMGTATSRLVGAVKVPNQIAHQFVDAGFWDPSKIVWNSLGGIKTFKGNPFRPADMDLYMNHPDQFYEQKVLPFYEKLKLNTLAERGRENLLLFGRTGGNTFTLYDRQREVSHRSIEAQKKALGLDASVGVAAATFGGQVTDYEAQKQTLQVELGRVILPDLIHGLKILNPLLKDTAHWIGQHKTFTKGLLEAFAGLGVLVIASGSLMAIGGAFRLIGGAVTAGGGLSAGLVGVARSLAGLGAVVGAWEVGQKAGTYLYDHTLKGTNVSDSIGRYFTTLMAEFGDKDSKDILDTEDRYFHKSKGTPVVAHVNMMLDQQKLGSAVLKFHIGGLSSPETGISGFDGLQHLAPAGAGAF